MAATNKRGVFSLEKVLEKQGDDKWTDIFDPFIYVTSVHPAVTAGPATGYFAGGFSPAAYESRVDRIDYANDSATASPKGNLSTKQAWIYGGASSTSHGYAFGGATDSNSESTVVNRIDYGNDTATASPKGPLSVGRRQHSAVGNINYGYAGGGYSGPSWNQTSIIDRVDYSSDTGTMVAVNPGGMTPGAYKTISAGNQSHGYFAGGYDYWTTGGFVSIVRRLDYANDTTSTSPRGSMTTQGGDGAGTGNANYGYFKSSANATSTIERLDYANDTANLLSRGGILTYQAVERGATGSAAYGYFGGGNSPDFSYVDRVDYASDTAAAAPKGKLTVPKYAMAVFSSREYGLPQIDSERSITPATQSERTVGPAYGYYAGGQSTPAGNQSKILRLDYANDSSTMSARGNLPTTLYNQCSTGTGSYGYTFGGTTPAGGSSSVTYRVDYANDAANASSKGYLSSPAVQYSAAVGNSNYGYIQGGNNYLALMMKYDFANDSSNASSLGNIFNPSAYSSAAVGNSNYGYFVGGVNPSVSNTLTHVRRVDYSNDTGTTPTKGPLSSATSDCDATGNSNFGYVDIFDGYVSPATTSSTTRIEYANDTATSSPKGKLLDSQYGPQFYRRATGDANYGYWFGGVQPNSAQATINSRLDYANDTATATPKGALSNPLQGGSAFSGRQNQFNDAGKVIDKGSDGYINEYPSQAYGYWTGGGPSISTRIDRLDYANDTAAATPKGELFDYLKLHGGASSLTHGYTFGGETPSYGYYTSVVSTINYSNDTATTAMKGPLSAGRRYVASVGNINFGYTGSGTNPSVPNVRSMIDRVDYSNDSTTAVAKGSMVSGNLYGYGACGNQNFGYFMAGYNNGYRSDVQRVDYANDTNPTSWRSYLATAATAYVGATGNADFGYVGYGYNPSSGRTIIDRIDYSNDTTVTRKGNFTRPGYYRGATGNGSYGYWSGLVPSQWAPGYYTDRVFDRLDYANDTATTLVKGSLGLGGARKAAVSAAEGGTPTFAYIPRVRFIDLVPEGTGATPFIAASVAGPAHGYWAGGDPSQTRVDRLDFDNDTSTASPKGNLDTIASRAGGTGNLTHGYVFGGNGYSYVQRVDYANDTDIASQRGRLWTPSADYCSSVGNNDFGYTGGRPWSYSYSFGKVDYSNDTVQETQLGNSYTFYPGPGYYGYGAYGNRNYGYFIGGNGSTYVRRVDYANDTAQLSIRGRLDRQGDYNTGTGNADYGYSDTYYYSIFQRLDFANDTVNALSRGNFQTYTYGHRSACGTGNYGYFAGGPGAGTRIERIDYASDTATASPKGPLSQYQYDQSGFSARENGNPQITSPEIPESAGIQAPFQPPFPFPVQAHNPAGNFSYAYFGGGSNPSAPSPSSRSIIDRIEYANDTSTATPKGTLSGMRVNYSYKSTGVSSPLFGYLLGFDNTYNSKADRIDYSNDTAAAANVALFSLRNGSASAGNANYGYIAGGVDHGAYITRIDYSNETTTSAANLTVERYFMYGAAGNQSYGYFMGGYHPSTNPSYQSSVERLDYSSDTTSPTVRGPLNIGRQNFFGGVGNANYGYIGGGSPPFELSSVERIDFNNDTATASPKGPLSTTKQYISGAGTTSYGYVAGGEQNNPIATFSTIDRIDFASDTATASPKGPLSEARYGMGSVSATTNAKTP